jgi:carboxypeptidase C (cathepsin A)
VETKPFQAHASKHVIIENTHSGTILEYFVESLPDISQGFMTEMYSGVINLNMSDDSRGLFFVFQPRVGAPVDEITIWFNGGPGTETNEQFSFS